MKTLTDLFPYFITAVGFGCIGLFVGIALTRMVIREEQADLKAKREQELKELP